ncbi:MAG: hypothetical protein AAGF31_05105 [Planctomycetota bacterium]
MASTEKPRVVVLGASNVRRGFPSLVKTARSMVGEPVDVLAAMGHGRSYGKWSSIPGRSLPGILQSGLWRAVDDNPPAETIGLITDVGNDLLYGVEPSQLLDWVATCIENLRSVNARIVITELPLASLATLGERRYRFFRTLFFPTCSLTLEALTDHAHEVNDGLHALAKWHHTAIANAPGEWYGFDPIHVRRHLFSEAWKKILSFVIDNESTSEAMTLSIAKRLALAVATPDERRLLGVRKRTSQPSCMLNEGSSIAFY